jgi:hypothetical protein
MKHLKRFNENFEKSKSFTNWLNSSNKNENWVNVFTGYEGYRLYLSDDIREQIKSELDITDADIKDSISEMQEDRSQTFLVLKINVNAIPDDKKEGWLEKVKALFDR